MAYIMNKKQTEHLKINAIAMLIQMHRFLLGKSIL